MRRKPRKADTPLYARQTLLLSLLQGAMVLAIVLAVFMVSLHLYKSDGVAGIENARTLTFTTLIIANLALILTNRSWTRSSLDMLRSKNTALWFVIGGTLTFLGLVLYVPFLRDLFHFSRLHSLDLLISLFAGLASILWFEAFKQFRKGETR
jgi:Ca2+-transporting ATPase